MGSFFLGDCFNDLDLAAVVDCSRAELVDYAERIHGGFRDLARISHRIRCIGAGILKESCYSHGFS